MAGSPHVLRELQLLPLNPSPSNAQPVCIRRNSHPMHDNMSHYNAQTGSRGDPISQSVHVGACIDVNSSSESDDGFANEEAPFILRLSHITKASPNGQKRASSNPKSGPTNSEPTKMSYFEHARTLDGVSLRANEDEEGVLIVRKKLRLSKEDSSILEERFKEHSTLNPNQKIALSKQLNLRPRQVEVWFQNRRARTKLKQIEVDCEELKKCCEMLSEENRRLQKEIVELRALTKGPGTTLALCPSRECPSLRRLPPIQLALAPSISPPKCHLTSSHHLLAPSL